MTDGDSEQGRCTSLAAKHWRQVRWRSRRGMLELDLLLTKFAAQRYPLLDDADQAAYRHLLTHDDWQLWDWLQGQPPARDLARIVHLVAAFGVGEGDGSGAR